MQVAEGTDKRVCREVETIERDCACDLSHFRLSFKSCLT